MIVTCVYVHVKAAYVEAFIEASKKNHEGSVKEKGNLRFDVLQDAADPTRFLLYEVYEDEAAVAAHKQTPHYLTWRETVVDWMASPRKGVRHRVIAPTLLSDW